MATFQDRKDFTEDWNKDRKENYRVELVIPDRKNKPVHVYASDLRESRSLEFLINHSDNPNIKRRIFECLAIADTNRIT